MPLGEFFDLLSTAWNTIATLTGQATINNLSAIVGKMVIYIAGVWQAQGTVQYNQHDAVQNAVKDFEQVGRDLETIEGYWEANFSRLTETIIPNALQDLHTVVNETTVKPTTVEVKRQSVNLNAINKAIADLDAWRKVTVTPALSKDANFISEFTAHDAPAIKTLITWLSKPGVFVKYAAPILTGPIVATLESKTDDGLRDGLALSLVKAWSSKPDDIFTAVTEWLVA
jgi:hypothetical protein